MKKKDATDRFVLWSGLLGVALWALDAAPSLVLRDDMRCAGVPRISTRLNPDSHPVCAVGKLHVFLLQSLMLLVSANLFKVHKQLEASAKMNKYAPGPATRAALLLLVAGLPAAMALLSLLLAADPTTHADASMRVRRGGEYNLYGLNRINDVRYQFTCGPFFDTIAQELAVVTAPLVLAGAANIVLSAMVLSQVLRMTDGRTGSKNEAVRRLAITMLRFASIVVTISLLGFVATALFFPEGERKVHQQLWSLDRLPRLGHLYRDARQARRGRAQAHRRHQEHQQDARVQPRDLRHATTGEAQPGHHRTHGSGPDGAPAGVRPRLRTARHPAAQANDQDGHVTLLAELHRFLQCRAGSARYRLCCPSEQVTSGAPHAPRTAWRWRRAALQVDKR
jgi:hypothetical protein